MNNKELNSDAQRWQQVYKRMDRTRNAQTNILSGTGNPWPWEDYETAVKGAKGATKAFIDASGAYNPKTGQYDLIKVNRAIRLNQDNDWSADEAREIAIPLSDRVNSIVRSAPSMNIKEIPKSYEGLTIGDDRYHEKDPKVLSQKYDEIASKLVKNVGPYDSLLVTRRKLFNNGNYNKRDFLEVLERMKGMGFTLSPYHLQEEGLLQEELRLTPGEIFSGYGLRKYFREPRKLK